ncbi:MAG: hypothetical protein KC944_25155, partial [Candidatus Omnitrophica bacterium]|nr:hypothetical protein [Candidatus Omnitrophota bacterium]
VKNYTQKDFETQLDLNFIILSSGQSIIVEFDAMNSLIRSDPWASESATFTTNSIRADRET